MNPYLEHPDMWPEVHHMLISVLAETLTPQLLPKYRAAIDKRVYYVSGEDALLVGIPDVTVDERAGWAGKTPQTRSAVAMPISTPIKVQVPRECIPVLQVGPHPPAPSPKKEKGGRSQSPSPALGEGFRVRATKVGCALHRPIEFREGYLEIREVASLEVITVIELLSPANKRSGKGRAVYEEKRQQVLSSPAHLIEIDLLREGKPMLLLGYHSPSDYRIMVSRRNVRPQADLYGFHLRDRIPSFPIPLRQGDTEPTVDLQAALSQVYHRLSYHLVIDYNREPLPPLSDDDCAWADALLRKQGLR
jgi:hypothetical protein